MNISVVEIYKVHDWKYVFGRESQKGKYTIHNNFTFDEDDQDMIYRSSPEKINGLWGARYSSFPPNKGDTYSYIWIEDEHMKKLKDEGKVERVRLSRTEKAKYLLQQN